MATGEGRSRWASTGEDALRWPAGEFRDLSPIGRNGELIWLRWLRMVMMLMLLLLLMIRRAHTLRDFAPTLL